MTITNYCETVEHSSVFLENCKHRNSILKWMLTQLQLKNCKENVSQNTIYEPLPNLRNSF